MTALWPVTGIGSLGHVDPAAAVRDVLDLGLDVPFWPQLPRRGAGATMIVQAANATRLLQPLDARGAMWQAGTTAAVVAAVRDAVARADARGFEPEAAGLTELARAGRRFAHLKGQWTGPATLAATVMLEGGVALADDPQTLRPVLDALHLSCLAQARLLLQHAERVDFWLDEPLLGTLHGGRGFDVAAARAWYARLASACGAAVRLGVHSCAGLDPALFELDVPVVSFDATSGVGSAGAALRAHLQNGWVAWGVVPTAPDAGATLATVLATLDACMAGLESAPATVAARSFLTPACGLAGLDAESGIARLRLARDAAATLRRRPERC